MLPKTHNIKLQTSKKKRKSRTQALRHKCFAVGHEDWYDKCMDSADHEFERLLSIEKYGE